MPIIAEVNRTKSGGVILKAKAPITLSEGDVLFLNTPEERVKGLVERGYVDAAQGEAELNKIPDFVLFQSTGIGKSK